MGDVIRKNAAAEDIFADLATSDASARAYTGPADLKPLADRYLKPHLTLRALIADKRSKAEEAYRPLKAKVDAEDEAADALLLRVSDDIWNDTGRSMEDPAYDVLFPGGIGYYTEGRDEEQPVRMSLLATLLESGVHPGLPAIKAAGYATQVRAAAKTFAAAIDAAREPRLNLELFDRVFTAIARSAHLGLTNFKRALKLQGLSEAQIHRIIPDRPRGPAAKPTPTPAEPKPPAP